MWSGDSLCPIPPSRLPDVASSDGGGVARCGKAGVVPPPVPAGAADHAGGAAHPGQQGAGVQGVGGLVAALGGGDGPHGPGLAVRQTRAFQSVPVAGGVGGPQLASCRRAPVGVAGPVGAGLLD